jgi:hypothetical protein
LARWPEAWSLRLRRRKLGAGLPPALGCFRSGSPPPLRPLRPGPPATPRSRPAPRRLTSPYLAATPKYLSPFITAALPSRRLSGSSGMTAGSRATGASCQRRTPSNIKRRLARWVRRRTTRSGASSEQASGQRLAKTDCERTQL